MKRTQNPIVLVDFDGVIHSYKSGWKGADVIPDPPVSGAIEWLMDHLPIPEAISAMGPEYRGPEVQIYSSRSRQKGGITAMKEWLIKHGLPKPYITDEILKFPTEKQAAFLTIDDRSICFEGRWPTTQEMLSFKPWNKRDFGATGQFPDGKLNEEDEGELQFGIAHDKENVIINFGKPVTWFGLPPYQARELAVLILKHADEV